MRYASLFIGLLFLSCPLFAQVPEKAPRLWPITLVRGEKIPTPPHQNSPWKHGDDALSIAAAALFAQGLPNPQGCEYREIEISIGSIWGGGAYLVKTHGFVLPIERRNVGYQKHFAIAWDGLIYPLASAEKPCDFREILNAKGPFRMPYSFSSADVMNSGVSPIQLAFLMRLGEAETAKRLWKQRTANRDRSVNAVVHAYFGLARDWTWNVYDRAIGAQMRGDDYLTLHDVSLLNTVVPRIKQQGVRFGLKIDKNSDDTKKQYYLGDIAQYSSLFVDIRERVANKPVRKGEIERLIFDLQNVNARQWGQPGGVAIGSDPRVQKLIKYGSAAVPLLIETMEKDKRLTRSVGFHRDFFRSRNIISVAQAADSALQGILHFEPDVYYYGDEKGRTTRVAQWKTYWATVGQLPLEERWYRTLKDEKATSKQWIEAAQNIIAPLQYLGYEKPEQLGEKLRTRNNPSISDLIEKRVQKLSHSTEFSSRSGWDMGYAFELAFLLKKWDGQRGIPVIKALLTRAITFTSDPQDRMYQVGERHQDTLDDPIANATDMLGKSGDRSVWKPYAAWVRKIKLEDVVRDDAILEPLATGIETPEIAATVDYLFNDPKSPLSRSFAESHYSWVRPFDTEWSLWKSEIGRSKPFKKYLKRFLNSNTPAGKFSIEKPQAGRTAEYANLRFESKWSSGSMGYAFAKTDDLLPPPGKQLIFRTSDFYAWLIYQQQKGPQIELYWPEAKRDAAVAETKKWLEAN